jgi:hypothetical protein
MALDSLVQSSLSALGSLRADDAALALPAAIVRAMTVDVEPCPLHFANALATVANVRADAHPQANVQSVTMALVKPSVFELSSLCAGQLGGA